MVTWINLKEFFNLDAFSIISGCRVNFQKSQSIYFGSMKDKIQKPFINEGLQWTEQELKYLGVKISLTNCLSESKNTNEKLKNFVTTSSCDKY